MLCSVKNGNYGYVSVSDCFEESCCNLLAFEIVSLTALCVFLTGCVMQAFLCCQIIINFSLLYQ